MHQPVNPTWKLHHYYFDGACKPGGPGEGCHESFSVGIFRIEQANGLLLYKRGKVVIRVRGYRSQAEEVYSSARAICKRLNNGESITDWQKDFWAVSKGRKRE